MKIIVDKMPEYPFYYTGVYCEDKGKMKKFLTDCLELINEEE